MSYGSFYKNIYRTGKSLYKIIKGNEVYGAYKRVEEALYERDRLMSVDWDWDLYMELPEIPNKYDEIELPPFDHEPSHISRDRERWVVRTKGSNQKTLGTFYNKEEAEHYAKMHDANASYKSEAFRVQRYINGETVYFGRFRTYEEAEAKVEELNKNGWVK